MRRQPSARADPAAMHAGDECYTRRTCSVAALQRCRAAGNPQERLVSRCNTALKPEPCAPRASCAGRTSGRALYAARHGAMTTTAARRLISVRSLRRYASLLGTALSTEAVRATVPMMKGHRTKTRIVTVTKTRAESSHPRHCASCHLEAMYPVPICLAIDT